MPDRIQLKIRGYLSSKPKSIWAGLYPTLFEVRVKRDVLLSLGPLLVVAGVFDPFFL